MNPLYYRVEKGLRSKRFRGPMLVHDIAEPLLSMSPVISPAGSHADLLAIGGSLLATTADCLSTAVVMKEDGLTLRRVARAALKKKMRVDLRVCVLFAHILMRVFPEVDAPAVHIALIFITLFTRS